MLKIVTNGCYLVAHYGGDTPANFMIVNWLGRRSNNEKQESDRYVILSDVIWGGN